MTDQNYEEAHEMIDISPNSKTANVRRGGWPKGKPRAKGPTVKTKKAAQEATAKKAASETLRPKAEVWKKMRAAPNWESEDFVGAGTQGGVDKLRIEPEIIDALHRDGVSLQWATHQIRGKPTPEQMMEMARGGWTPVHADDFDGILDGRIYGVPRGNRDVITVEDCMLVARPVEIHAKAKMQARRDALDPVQRIEHGIKQLGIPVLSGGNHRTALAGNHITRTVERIEIPE